LHCCFDLDSFHRKSVGAWWWFNHHRSKNFAPVSTVNGGFRLFLDLNLQYVCFSVSICVVFVCFGELAPPLIGVALMNVHRDLRISGNSSRTSRR
jgi:hypothetical protein